MIRRARERVLIANAYFVPWRALADELRRAARRGARVVVLTNSPATNDIESVAVVSRYTFLDLLQVNEEPAVRRSGGRIEIHEWEGAPHREGTLHAKYALFDDQAAVIGSFNLDPRSARLNSETALALRQGALVRAMARVFLEQKLPMARRITLAQARELKKPGDVAVRFKLLFALPIRDWL